MIKKRATIIFDEEAKLTDAKKDVIPTFDVSVRVDNHARNSLLALAKTTGEKRTVSEMLSVMIENYTNNLSDRTRESYNEYLSALEEKDKLSFKLKNH